MSAANFTAARTGWPSPRSVPALGGTTFRLTPEGFRWARAIGDVLLEISFLDDGLLKVRRVSLAAAHRSESPSPAVISLDAIRAHTLAQTLREVVETDRTVLHTAELRIEVSHASGLLTVATTAGRVLFSERAVDAGDGSLPQTLRVAAGARESFYGLGQKVRGENDTSLRWNGLRREFGPLGNAREKSCPGVSGQGNGNTSIPLLLSTAGYGLFFDNHYRHCWDFTDAACWTLTADRGEHRYYFLAGPETPRILQRYVALTGRPAMPPKWALGVLQSKFGYKSWDEVDAVADRYRAARIPCDAIILDLYWFGGVPHFGGAHRIGSMEWDAERFGDARARIAALAERGFKVILIEEPYLDQQTVSYAEAERDGFLAMVPCDQAPGGARPAHFDKWWGAGGLLDVTNPDARRWWWRKHLPLIADGVAGWWADLGEPEHYDERSRYRYAPTHADVHNVYNLEWVRALADGYSVDRPGDRFFILTRSGYAGIQRHGAALWSNDVMTAFEWLAPQIATGLNMGLSGIPWWGTDVGGFIGPVASEALYTRWFQFGALSPICRPHGQDRPTAPFEFSSETEEICRTYARLRYQLLPYLYGLAREAYDTGLPVMRPLALAFPDDPDAADLGSQYLLGPSLLVAPVVTDATTRDVYLPAGEWIDFWTQTRFSGPRLLRDYPAPLDTMPLFVRAGAILPMAPVMDHVNERPLDPLTLRVYPARERSTYVLYEDDGASTAYEADVCARTAMSATPHGRGVVLEVGPAVGAYQGMPESRELRVELVVPARPQGVVWNGAMVPESLAHAPGGDRRAVWSYCQRDGVLRVRIPRSCVRSAHRLEVIAH